jgi:hypothetical protein
MTPKNNIESTQPFNKDDMSFIMACLLGDGCLSDKGKLVIAHGNSQQDYNEWKANRLSKIFGQEIKALKTRQCTQIQVQRKCLKKIRQAIYPNNIKNVNEILKFISNPLEAIAIWIMDDGNVNPSIYKSTTCYSAAIQIFTFTDLEDTIKIANWFEKQIGMRPNMLFMDRSKSNRKSAYKLKFNASDSRKLFNIIKEYIPNIPSMNYKFRYMYILEYNHPTSPVVKEELLNKR